MKEKKFSGAFREDIFNYVKEKYNTSPEYLWNNSPDTAVLRHSDNKKWYGAILSVSKSKLGLNGNEVIDILDLKCSPLMLGSLTMTDGIFPAYHMNKQHWISVLLDGTVDKEQVFSLVDMSYELTKGKTDGSKKRSDTKSWLIPANPKVYDLEKGFSESKIMTWHQDRNIISGDTVYIYVGAPVSAIMYKCNVTETNIPDYKNNRKLMKIRLVHRFDKNDVPLSRMRELDVYGVRSARGVPYSLSKELNKIVNGD